MRKTFLFGAAALTLLAGLSWAADATRVKPADNATADFFNGKNLDGWEGLVKEYWSVKDGAIVGSTLPKRINFNTFLCSKKKYKDFELKFKIRLKDGAGNSGVQIRSKILDPAKFAVTGPQCDIGQAYWGGLYGENFGGMMKAADPRTVRRTLKPNDFNDYYIKCVGKHVTIKLNGETTMDEDFPRCRRKASSPGNSTPASRSWK